MSSQHFRGQDPDTYKKWLRPFFPMARVYRSTDGETLIVFERTAYPPGKSSPTGPIQSWCLDDTSFLSEGDGTWFRQAYQERSKRTGEDVAHTHLDANGKGVTVLSSKEAATLLRGTRLDTRQEWKHLSPVANVAEILERATFVPPPATQIPVFAAVRANGNLVYVDIPKYEFDFADCRCFMGPRGALVRAKDAAYEPYKDGGTVVVRTDVGIAFAPARGRTKNLGAYWLPAGTDMERLVSNPSKAGDCAGVETLTVLDAQDTIAMLNLLLPE